jgi:hypothetical protein
MPVSLLPQQTGSTFGGVAAATPGLTDDEKLLITGLATKLATQTTLMRLAESYYTGTQRLYSLGVSIPPQLQGVRTVVDWPRICIDPLVQRCVVDGFRLPGATDSDEEMWGHWQANDLDAEAPLCFLDALIYGRGYMIVGSPDEASGSPLVTVESPLNLAMTWDPRTRQTTAAYQAYEVEGVYRAVLYLPAQTILMSREWTSGWTLDNRDRHGFGEVPVVRFANRQRSVDREGQSEITPAIMNTTDSACRSLLGMEIAREFYSVPHRWIMGASESDFRDAAGNPKSAIDMVMSKMLAFESREDGTLPQVGQFSPFDPTVFTKIVDKHGQLMSSYTQFPPDWFGQTTTSNPASADAIRSAQDGVNRRGRQVQNQFSDPLERVQRLIWRFANNGQQPPTEYMRMETDWAEVATPTPAATSDAIFKQVQMGSIPPTSDVTLSRLGYSAVERARLEIDRQVDAGQSVLAELAASLQAKEARVDLTVARDINPTAANSSNVQPNNNSQPAG